MAKVVLDWKTLHDFTKDAFMGVGVPEEDAEIVVDILLESDRRGIESHGCNRFKPIYIDRINAGIQQPVTNFEILKETPTTAVVDGHHGMGQVIGYKAMSMAIEKAKKYGMGMVTVRNSTHYGIAGYYTSMATKAGCIGMTGTNARPSVAPTLGVEGMFGTNPFTLGVPTDEDFDFNFDCATSITQNGKVEYYERIGEEIHPGTVIDIDGNPVDYEEYRYFYLNTKHDMDGGDESFWSKNPEKEAELKDKALTTLSIFYALYNLANEYEVAVSEEVRANIDASVQSTLDSEQKEDFLSFLESIHTNVDYYKKICEFSYLEYDLYEKLSAEGVIAATTEDVTDLLMGDDYVRVMHILYADEAKALHNPLSAD